MRVRAATQDDVVSIVAMLADDDLGRHRESVEQCIDICGSPSIVGHTGRV